MNPDHMPRPFRPELPDPEPIRVWVHGGDFTETDLIRALDEVMTRFAGCTPRALGRAAAWLHAKYGEAA